MNAANTSATIDSPPRVRIWTLSGHPLNSIRLQSGLLAVALQTQLKVDADVLDSGVPNYKRQLAATTASQVPIIWQFGGFDRHLTPKVARSRHNLYVYHNITPARFFIGNEPKVAFGSLLGQLQLRLLPKWARWVTCSSFNAIQLREFGFKNVELCPNIVPSPAVISSAKRLPPRLIFVGRIAPNKCCIHLLEQVSKTANALRERVVLTIIGRVKVGCRHGEAFQSMVESLKYDQWITIEWIRREVSDAELTDRYAAASLYISSASHEGFGLPACEAIASGTPAIYVECGGTESILDGHGMVPAKERDSMWRYIVTLLRDRESYAELLAAQQQCVSKFTYPTVAETIKSVYGGWLAGLRT